MRFAGTCSMYSKSAMPQLARMGTISGFAPRSRRCAYHAKVMKTLEPRRRRIVRARTGICGGLEPVIDSATFFDEIHRGPPAGAVAQHHQRCPGVVRQIEDF